MRGCRLWERPSLRFLSIQDTTANDDAWVALARSRTIEQIFGPALPMACEGKGTARFPKMPALHGLSVGCLEHQQQHHCRRCPASLPSELMPMDIPDAATRRIGTLPGARVADPDALPQHVQRRTTEHLHRPVEAHLLLQQLHDDHGPGAGDPVGHRVARAVHVTDACHGLADAGVHQLAHLPAARATVREHSLAAGMQQRFTHTQSAPRPGDYPHYSFQR